MKIYDPALEDILSTAAKEGPGLLQKDIELLISLNESARRDGLLVLEEKIKEIPDLFIKLAVTLIVDGTEPGLVRQVLRTARHSGGFSKLEQARRILIEEGVIAIQEGITMSLFKTMLYAFIGEDKAASSISY